MKQIAPFLYSSRRRNRFTCVRGPKSIYFGEDEDVGAAEVKRTALLGSFAKKASDPAGVFWAKAHLSNAVLDLTDLSVLRELGATDAEVHDPDWRDFTPPSLPELLGQAAFDSGRFAAIKYWSVQSRSIGKNAFCLCIFKTRVKKLLWVHFTFPGMKHEERWP